MRERLARQRHRPRPGAPVEVLPRPRRRKLLEQHYLLNPRPAFTHRAYPPRSLQNLAHPGLHYLNKSYRRRIHQTPPPAPHHPPLSQPHQLRQTFGTSSLRPLWNQHLLVRPNMKNFKALRQRVPRPRVWKQLPRVQSHPRWVRKQLPRARKQHNTPLLLHQPLRKKSDLGGVLQVLVPGPLDRGQEAVPPHHKRRLPPPFLRCQAESPNLRLQGHLLVRPSSFPYRSIVLPRKPVERGTWIWTNRSLHI